MELKASKREERETERLQTSGRRDMVRASFTRQMTTVDDRLVPPTSTCAAHDSMHSFIHNHDSAQRLFALESSRRASARASCGTTRIITPTGRLLSVATQRPHLQ